MEHIVAPGEGTALIAWKHGFFWRTLWTLAENAGLAALRRNPEVLLAGDRMVIPEPRAKQIACATGARHVFRRKGVPSKVALEVRAPDDTPFANKRYQLVADDMTYEGTTGQSGEVTQWIAPTLARVDLTVWLDDPAYPATITFTLQVGHLDPVTTLSGVQSRLVNLGYDLAGELGREGSLTAAAIRAVQARSGLPSSGVLDDATRRALVTLHRS